MNIPPDIQICSATATNWRRLHVEAGGRLASRANKTLSSRKIVASAYGHSPVAHRWLADAVAMDAPVEEVMATLCERALHHLTAADGDILGFVYQSLCAEGERNRAGIYYTHEAVTGRMLRGLHVARGETFLDPCCGSGAFLLAVDAESPASLVGFDSDPVAVMIARTNLRIKYRDSDFTPDIRCLDFLASAEANGGSAYDYIFTNPPWGTDKSRSSSSSPLHTRERASLFLWRALQMLKPRGQLNFLLPTSLFHVRSHAAIRSYILNSSAIEEIIRFPKSFDGVFTDFVSLRLRNSHVVEQRYKVCAPGGCRRINLPHVGSSSTEIPLSPVSRLCHSIIRKMEQRRFDDLSRSRWALGIVTGNNKSKLLPSPAPSLEPIYSGKQVTPFVMEPAAAFIRFSPQDFQQCAKEEFYRSPEKLVYRFIARRPVVAYDCEQRLCLNSANIVIPCIEGCSVKSAAALLNSSLYAFYYSTICSDIKVLKSQLCSLPFPRLTARQNTDLSRFTDEALTSGFHEELQQRLDTYVYNIFGINKTEQKLIESI
ncbi:MAG: N-6 DNA methylase [Bacteroidaceae bacterium]|nr:N-6 DNA methylase [Bacteroidaceae bacterium]